MAEKYPFETYSDMQRYFLRDGLERLESEDPTTHPMNQIRAMEDILAEEEENFAFVRMFDRLGVMIDQYLDRGSEGLAKSSVNRVYQSLVELPDGAIKDFFSKEFERRFGQWMSGEGVSLVEMSD